MKKLSLSLPEDSLQVPVILLGNKCDCNAIRQVPSAAASGWARANGIKPYEVTVMNRDCLKEPFCYIAWRMGNPGKNNPAQHTHDVMWSAVTLCGVTGCDVECVWSHRM